MKKIDKKISSIAGDSRKLERYFKGVSNHHRIAILLLVEQKPNLTVDDICTFLHGNFKTISHHTNKLVTAGLLNKRYSGTHVLHTLSPFGKRMIILMHQFSNS